MMTREEMLNEAKRKRQEEKNKPKTNFQGFEQPEWHSLETTYTQFRFVGNYPDVRCGDPTAAKTLLLAKIVGDDGKQFRCIFPTREEKKDWIMWRILNLVLDGKWDSNAGRRIDKYEGRPIYKQVKRNGSDDARDSGWYPKKVVVANVIARDKMEWHRANKKTLLLSKKCSIQKDGKSVYSEVGIPASAYQKIMDDIIAPTGDVEMYDIVMKRLANDPYYKAFHAADDMKHFRDELSTFPYYETFAIAPLTEEERSWERWNIDKMFPVTSYTKLYNHLHVLVEKIDAEFGTRFAVELKQYADEEAAEWAKQDNASNSAESEDDDEAQQAVQDAAAEAIESQVSEGIATPAYSAPTSVAPVTRNPPPAQPAAAPVSRRSTAPVGVDFASLSQTHRGVDHLTAEEKACIVAVNADGSFIYRVASGVNANCICEDEVNCKFIAPETFHVCPKCSRLFGTDGTYADVPF